MTKSIFFPGWISGTVLSVGRLRTSETIELNSEIFGAGVEPGTRVYIQISGVEGGPGTYLLTKSQTVASGTLEARS